MGRGFEDDAVPQQIECCDAQSRVAESQRISAQAQRGAAMVDEMPMLRCNKMA